MPYTRILSDPVASSGGPLYIGEQSMSGWGSNVGEACTDNYNRFPDRLWPILSICGERNAMSHAPAGPNRNEQCVRG